MRFAPSGEIRLGLLVGGRIQADDRSAAPYRLGNEILESGHLDRFIGQFVGQMGRQATAPSNGSLSALLGITPSDAPGLSVSFDEDEARKHLFKRSFMGLNRLPDGTAWNY